MFVIDTFTGPSLFSLRVFFIVFIVFFFSSASYSSPALVFFVALPLSLFCPFADFSSFLLHSSSFFFFFFFYHVSLVFWIPMIL